jgi:hypothetical protein
MAVVPQVGPDLGRPIPRTVGDEAVDETRTLGHEEGTVGKGS